MIDSRIDRLLAEADAHLRAKRFDQATLAYQHLLTLDPKHARARATLGELMMFGGLHALAEEHLAAAVAADPSLINAAKNLASLYRNAGKHLQARDLLRDVVQRDPQFTDAWYDLGLTALLLDDFDTAIEAFEAVLRQKPRHPKALVNLSIAYRLTMRFDRCLDCLRRANEQSATAIPHSMLLFNEMFALDRTPEQLAALAESWDARFAAPLRLQTPAFDNVRDPDRPLRIGYVSPNFYQHAIGWLVEPVIAGQDRAQFSVYCYSDVSRPDALTERFRAMSHTYRETASLSDEQLAQMIRQDGIDILVDLNLHLVHARLGVFARRPAPVQMTYLGYPFTSGLRTLDYRITDSILDPPGQTPLGSEALFRLHRCFLLYRPDAEAPPPADHLPARATGHVTFASLNFARKISPGVAAAWANILNRLPSARLLLLADHLSGQRPHIERFFGEVGLDPARLDLVGPTQHAEYLARYQKVDLCLDPFPYGGHTTTLDALWMGVPVVALAGDVSYRRGAASILTYLGLPELVTQTVEEYQDLAVALASDLDRLEGWRRGLRERMQASVLCDEKGWVADYERGLRLAWRRYCKGLLPAEIELE